MKSKDSSKREPLKCVHCTGDILRFGRDRFCSDYCERTYNAEYEGSEADLSYQHNEHRFPTHPQPDPQENLI